MRKIVKPTERVRLDAIVEKDGVGFIPTKINVPASISFNGPFAKFEEEIGEIKYEYIDFMDNGKNVSKKSKMDEKIYKSGFRVLLFSAIMIVAALAMMLVSVSWPNEVVWINAFASIIYLMMLPLVLPKAFAILIGRIFRNKDMISFSKYLGAKNAVENAYYDLGRAPNMDEVKNYSLYSSEDKYTKSAYLAALWLIISCARFFDGWTYWLITIGAILLLCYLDWRNKLAFVQALVVSKPEEKHYKVAIAAMEGAADGIDRVEIHTIDLHIDPENFDEERCYESGCPAYDICKEKSQEMAKNKRDNNSDK